MPLNVHFPQDEIDKAKAANQAELKAMLDSPRATETDRIYARLGLAISNAWYQWELEEISGKTLADLLPPVERMFGWMLADLLGSMDTTVGHTIEIARESARAIGDVAVHQLTRARETGKIYGVLGGHA